MKPPHFRPIRLRGANGPRILATEVVAVLNECRVLNIYFKGGAVVRWTLPGHMPEDITDEECRAVADQIHRDRCEDMVGR